MAQNFDQAVRCWRGQVFGEDLDMVGGPRLGRHIELTWELNHCGKLQTLRKLLLLWHKDVTNKVSQNRVLTRLWCIRAQCVGWLCYHQRQCPRPARHDQCRCTAHDMGGSGADGGSAACSASPSHTGPWTSGLSLSLHGSL